MNENLKYLDVPVVSYALASADMRYIEVGERDVFLRSDPEEGLVFRGEISGCGPECYVELNEILLEYAMSCEGCRDEEIALKEVGGFGKQLGEALTTKISPEIAELSASEKLSTAFKSILTSLGADINENAKADRIEYSLDCCPLSECASESGFTRSVEMAHLSFVKLCESVINSLAPGWILKLPSTEESFIPIHKIIIASL